MRIALINSGIGLLAAAAELHRRRADADLVLAMDPDRMPWGPRTPADIAARALDCARAAASYQPDVIVLACNTGSVHALGALRARFEPGIPVIGTVPAIKPAAAAAPSVAIWATVGTTGSAYQRGLIADFADGARVTQVACPGLADAIHAGDDAAARAAVAAAARRTPAHCSAVVLGCTEYELATGLIAAAVPGAQMFGSAVAVATQALRRAAGGHTGQAGGGPAHTRQAGGGASGPASGLRGRAAVHVLLSGRAAALPAAALGYPEGRLLASLMPDARPAAGAAGSARPADAGPRGPGPRSVPA